ncbi:MAG: heterodisulfide reductase-related iron-sulfur binding cluster [Aigarchaeota archaeon]|nr:heterodisulfide reductase-related iron-sulfur binding cluster [Aigarchaeota archaeon]
MAGLKNYKKDIYRCIHCKACRFAYSGEPDKSGYGDYWGMVHGCPAGNLNEWEAYWGSGKLWIIRAIMENNLELTEEERDILFQCPECGNCEVQCDNLIPITKIIEEARAAYVQKGLPLQERHKVFSESIEENNNPYREPHKDRTKWFHGQKNKKADVGYFVGCTGSYRLQDTASATAGLLGKLGENFAIFEDEVCCGSPLLRTGQTKPVERLIRSNVKLFKEAGIKELVFSCAGCYRTFKVDYPQYVGELPFAVKYVTEYVYGKIKKGHLKLKGRYDKKVTWHDPCHSGRHITLHARETMDRKQYREFSEEWYAMPKKVLTSVPGVEYREMYRVGENSWCCGAGGGVKSGYSNLAIETAKERIKEAEDVGADALVTACPFCYLNLRDAAKEAGSKIEVVDLLKLLDSVT